MENSYNTANMSPASTTRILDILCEVCGDNSTGRHYHVYTCDGCASFFKRSVRSDKQYVCTSNEAGTCAIDRSQRNKCRACRLNKCIYVGMNKDALQQERGPRDSTLRQMYMLPATIQASLVPPVPYYPPPPGYFYNPVGAGLQYCYTQY